MGQGCGCPAGVPNTSLRRPSGPSEFVDSEHQMEELPVERRSSYSDAVQLKLVSTKLEQRLSQDVISMQSQSLLDAAQAAQDSLRVANHLLGNAAEQPGDDINMLPETRAKLSFLLKRASCLSHDEGNGVTTLVEDPLFSELMRNVWPHLRSVLEGIIETKVQDALDRATDVVSLKGVVKMEKVELSDSPPEIGNTSCYRKRIGGQDAVEIDMRVRWKTQIGNFHVGIGPVSVGISHVEFDGEACLLLSPLLSTGGGIGGCSFFFLNPPSVRFSIVAAGGISGFSPVDSLVQVSLTNVLTDLLVLPRVVPLWVSYGVVKDLVSHRCPPPMGVFRVRVVAAKNLIARDWSLLGLRTSDPYCILKLGGAKHRTTTIMRTLNPTWTPEDQFDFLVFNVRQRLDLQLYDADALKSDDFLGCVVDGGMSVFNLLVRQEATGMSEVWLPVDTSHVECKHEGTDSSVCLQVQYLNVCKSAPYNGAQCNHESVLVSAKIELVEGKSDESLLGSRICLSVGDGPEVSSRGCHVADPRKVFGMDAHMVDIAFRLHDEFKLSSENIAELLQPRVTNPVGAIQEIIELKSRLRDGHGQGMKVGWNEAVFTVGRHTDLACAKLFFYRKGCKKGELLTSISLADLQMGARRGEYPLSGSSTVDITLDTVDLWTLPDAVAIRALSDGIGMDRPRGLESMIQKMAEEKSGNGETMTERFSCQFGRTASFDLVQQLSLGGGVWAESVDDAIWPFSYDAGSNLHCSGLSVRTDLTPSRRGWADTVDGSFNLPRGTPKRSLSQISNCV
eukprot:TRINITY_DN31000_c0_g1_i1.p1 TRINITY_DN31000_c0_g1~~TRINITY_DN31000_c0_g1_i1.p1  ORF type:complete len:789 (+),score=90.29 TRINITY_DN31000_c0_g1_i1:66-2432(+)